MRLKLIISLVCKEFGVTERDIKLKERRRQSAKVVEAKQALCYLLCRELKMSRDYVALLTGYHPSAVTRSANQVERIMSVDKHYKAQVESFREVIESIKRDAFKKPGRKPAKEVPNENQLSLF